MNRRFVRRIIVLGAFTAFLGSCKDIVEPVNNFRNIAEPVSGGRIFTDLALGDFHSCGLNSVGEVFCWGANQQGQSGNGLSANERAAAPIAVLGGFIFAKIYAGGSHSCGITTDGVSMCWGNNVGGQLGIGSVETKPQPTAVVGGQVFTSLTTSTAAHTCGLTAAGAAWCWGENEFGRLGDGTQTLRNAPVAVSGGIVFTSISAGGGHTCGLTAAGTAYCWGLNSRGQVGDGTTANKLVPVPVSTSLKFRQIAAGVAHTCALTEQNIPYCWGDNVAGALGDGTTTSSQNTPVPVAGGNDFTMITVGERHACGLTGEGIVLCWGFNQFGALGDGTFITRTTPVPLSVPILFKKIAAGGYHTCGISVSNVTFCWGDNSGLQLGAP